VAPGTPNAEQVEFWQTEGRAWLALEERHEAMVRPFGARALAAAAARPGERVLDVGCGCGGTTLELGRQVAPDGFAFGIDVSVPMLERARQRAGQAELDNVSFAKADAQVHDFAGESFDLAFSQFGVMFFADPTAAFANIGRAMRLGGRLAFVCWQPLERNDWMLVPGMAIVGVGVPLPPTEPGAPGPYQLADRDYLGGVLDTAGYQAIEIAGYEAPLTIGGGGNLDQAVDYLRNGTGRSLLEQVDDSTVARAVAAARTALAPYETPDGVVLPAATWIVTAHR
jgi:SAM-dependent methyltransferase